MRFIRFYAHYTEHSDDVLFSQKLLHLLENTFDRKRISTNLNPNPEAQ